MNKQVAMKKEIIECLSYFKDRYSINYNEVPLYEMPVFQKAMELLVVFEYVKVHRAKNGLISLAILTEGGIRKYNELFAGSTL